MGCIRRIILVILAAAILGTPIPVLAEEPVRVSVPVSCHAEGSAETFTYVLTPETPEEGQSILTGELHLTDGDEGSFLVEFTLPGTYTYTAAQKAGSRTDTVYSNEVYTVLAYVTENDEGAMQCELIAFRQSSTEKTDRLQFQNKVMLPTETPARVTPTKAPRATVTPRENAVSRRSASSGSISRPSATPRPSASIAGRVRTGDTTEPILFAGLAVSALMVIVSIWKSRKNRKEI